MGREIVYCWNCSTKLQSSDFEQKTAYRVGDKVSCANCVYDLVADLPAEEQEAILNPPSSSAVSRPATTKVRQVKHEGTTRVRRTGPVPAVKREATRTIPTVKREATGRVPTQTGTRAISRNITTRGIPKVRPPGAEEAEEGPVTQAQKKKKLLLIGVGAGVGVVVLVGVLVMAMGGSGGKPPAAEETPERRARAGAPVKKVEASKPSESALKDQAAQKALAEASEFKIKNPLDWPAILTKYREVEKLSEGTSVAGKTKDTIDQCLKTLGEEFALVNSQAQPFLRSGQENYSEAIKLLEGKKGIYPARDWSERIDARITEIKSGLLEKLKTRAVAAKRSGQDAKPFIDDVREIFGQESADEVGRAVEKTEVDPDAAKAASAGGGAPGLFSGRAMSPEMKAFFPTWQAAMANAFSRDYDQVATALQKAKGDAEATEVKQICDEDARDVRTLAKIVEEAKKAAETLQRFKDVTLEYREGPSSWKKITGKVQKVEAGRIELATEVKEKPKLFVEINDLSGTSLAHLYLERGGTDARGAALLCLLEGDAESARKMASASIPDRYLTHAAQARELAPKPSSREFEARNLFHLAEFEWREMRTRGLAAEKYKMLLGDYAGTEYGKRVQPIAAARADTGKEYLFYPADLKISGTSNLFKLSNKYAPKVEQALTASKDLDDPNQSLENYVEIEFYAMPNTSYRAWALLGGCCAEVLGFYYQTSEATVSVRGKNQPMDPGQRYAAPLPLSIAKLPKDHNAHKPKGSKTPGPKEPTVWEWVSIPLPKTYAQPGAKAIRLLTDQGGASVSYVIVSSTRAQAPNDAVTKQISQDLTAQTAGAPKIVTTPAPTEWLVAGPFGSNLNTDDSPVSSIELGTDLKGKSGSVRWKTVSPEVKGTHVVFDLAKSGASISSSSTYVAVHVKVPAAMDAKLMVGSHDGCRIWVNGKDVHKKDAKRALKIDEDSVPVKLDAGWNRILVKVYSSDASGALSFRVADTGKRPIDGLEYSPYGDALEPPK
jgi:hypothetical protein